MTGPPKVSVILTTYRRQSLLARSIQSVIDQTMGDWELIIVDDEPSEETRRIVASFGDNRIQYLAHEHNRGLCAARNTGIRAATASYLGFLDDDDEFLPEKLAKQLAVIEQAENEIGIVSCYEQIVGADGSMTARAIDLRGDMHPRLLQQDLVRMQLLLVRRECFDMVGLFDERLSAHDDYDMILRLSRRYRFSTVPEALVRIHETAGSMSKDVRNRIEAIEIMMRTHPEFRERPRVRSRWEVRLARHHAQLADADGWRRHLVLALRANPTNAVAWSALATGTVFGPDAHRRLALARGRFGRWRRGRHGL
jgi:glycosyltransferase involved in cell wall biosynthesis